LIRLLGHASSINVRKVLWTAAELDLALVHDELRGDSAEVRALNPHARVPVLVDGDAVVWESNTICRYLASRAGRHDLLPASPRDRARVEQWMDWQASELNPAWHYAFQHHVRKSAAHADAGAAEASVIGWNRLMTVLDGELAGRDGYVVGDHFTLVDIVLGVSIRRWQETPIARPDLPAIARYVRRLEQRDGFRRYGA
jgi:glutathione S-transferase